MYRRHLLVLALFLAAGCPTLRATEPDKPKPVRLRVLTYNIHHGEGNDRKFDLERIAKVILSVKPDLVAVQEVDRKTKRASGVDQAAELGRLTKMHSVFGKAMDYSGGQYGEAVLSRWPIISKRNVALSAPQGHEPRAALSVRVRVGDKGPTLIFVGTHLDHQKSSVRMTQVRELVDAFVPSKAESTNPKDAGVILAGDLNATPDSPELKTLRKHWRNPTADKPLPTVPVTNPRRQIDFVLYRPLANTRWRVVEARTIDEQVASDHLPLLVVLELTP